MSARNSFRISASLFATLLLLATTLSCKRNEPAPAPAPSASAEDSNQVYDSAHPLEVAVTSDGFVPARAKVKVGEPVTLFVTRKVQNTCATDIVIKDYGVNQPLPEGKRVQVTLTPKKPGPIRYACAMDMESGELVAE